MIEVLIPITLFLVTGAVFITYIYFHSREKQLMIEKGLSHEQMMELLKKRSRPYLLMQIGIMAVGLGVGLGLGFLFNAEEYMGFFVLTFLGIAAILASVVAKSMCKKDGNENC